MCENISQHQTLAEITPCYSRECCIYIMSTFNTKCYFRLELSACVPYVFLLIFCKQNKMCHWNSWQKHISTIPFLRPESYLWEVSYLNIWILTHQNTMVIESICCLIQVDCVLCKLCWNHFIISKSQFITYLHSKVILGNHATSPW